jgi:hypothetical protein
MAPQIRIFTPAQDQYIAAGTFMIKVGVVATDDRQLNSADFEIYADNVRLTPLGSNLLDSSTSADSAVTQAFSAMYDRIEHNYGAQMANDFGRRESPYAQMRTFVMQVPSGLVRFNETVELLALVKDSEASVGRHLVSFYGAADDINPEVAVTRPQVGYGPPEASDFTLGLRAFDNVKVARVEAYMAYGARDATGQYYRTDFGAPISDGRRHRVPRLRAGDHHQYRHPRVFAEGERRPAEPDRSLDSGPVSSLCPG